MYLLKSEMLFKSFLQLICVQTGQEMLMWKGGAGSGKPYQTESMITLMNAAQSVNGSLLTTSPWLQEKHVVPLSFCLETFLGTFNVTLDMMWTNASVCSLMDGIVKAQ